MRRPLAAILLGVASLSAAASSPASLAPPATMPATQPTPPTRTIIVQPGSTLHLLDIDPDGRTAYVLARVRQVNAWRVAASFWPEAAAVVVALATLRLLARAIRRRRERPGEMYCRRCRYHLCGLESNRCPECGTTLTKRTRAPGRRAWPRIAAASALLLATAAAYVATRDRLPRTGPISEWLDWRSTGLATWAMKHQHDWLSRHAAEEDVLLAIDLDAGRVKRQVCRLRLGDGGWFDPITLTSDRQRLFGVRPSSQYGPTLVVCRVDTATGELFEYPLAAQDAALYHVIVSQTGRTIFRRGEQRIVAYDAANGRSVGELSRGDMLWCAPYWPIEAAGHAGLCFITSEDGSLAKGLEGALWSPPETAPTRIKGPKIRFGNAVDEGRLYTLSDDYRIETWDLIGGRRLDSFRVNKPLVMGFFIVCGRTALVVDADNRAGAYDVVDLPTRTLRGTIQVDEMLEDAIVPSRDGRRVVSRRWSSSGDRMLIWDLPFPLP